MSNPESSRASQIGQSQLDQFLSTIDETVDDRLTNQRIEEHLRHIKERASAKAVDASVRRGVIRGDDEILVIGAGVSGLTSAICLAEAGFKVRVISKDLPLHTPSVAAGASWSMPHSDTRSQQWSFQTFTELHALAAVPGTGVRLVEGMEASRQVFPVPDWAVRLPGYQACQTNDLPAGFHTGWRATLPVIDMVSYLAYLTERLHGAGVTIELTAVSSLAQIEAATVLNCAGFGAGDLASDSQLVPLRTQMVVVENPGIYRFFRDISSDYEELTAITPHGDIVVLGGGTIPNPDSVIPDPEISAAIIARAAMIDPRLGNARVLGHRVGVRPDRSAVRVEKTVHNGQNILHNYGHGGSGVTLSWGCAREVLSMISD